jgi:YidC/Oxa1 family membrane protein insertase
VFHFLIVQPLTNLVLGFYQILGENLGLAIIFFTIFLRFVLLPLTVKQIRQQRKMAELQPRLQELQAQRKEKNQMSTEEMALMRQTAGSCVGGCLPLLIQIPILIGLNGVISKIASAKSGDIFNADLYFDSLKHVSEYKFNTSFLGFDLAKSPSQIPFGKAFIPFAILLILLVGTQFVQGKLMNFFQKKRKNNKSTEKKKPNQPKPTEKQLEKEKMQEDMQKMMQTQTVYFIPVIIGITSYSLSAALGLYWLVQNLFAIIQINIQNNMIDGNHDTLRDYFKNRNKNKVSSPEKFREVEYQDVENKQPKQKSKKQKNTVQSKKKKKK